MKETSTSLRYYFIFIGILGLLNLSSIDIIKTDLISGILVILSIIFGLIFLYIGIKFSKLIATSSKNIIKILYISTGYYVLVLLISIYRNQGTTIATISVIIGILILVYLVRNIKRIVKNNYSKI